MVIKSKLLRFSSLCVIGSITLIVNQMTVSNAHTDCVNGGAASGIEATDETKYVDLGQVTYSGTAEDSENTDENASSETAEEIVDEVDENAIPGIDYKDYIDLSSYSNLAIANVNQYLNVRKSPSADSSANIIAKMPPHSGCDILETTTNEAGEVWCKIKSGEVTGYVLSDYLIQGQEAIDLVPTVGRLVIIVGCDVLKVRTEPSLESSVLYTINSGEMLDVLAVEGDWVQVTVDIGGNEAAYVSKEYVSFSFELYEAIEIEELLTGYSTERTGIVATAKKYLGGKYVYGGTSLTTGIDCSAFMMKLYAMYGYTLHRSSRDQARCDGTAITSSQLQPGDLVFYSNGSGTVKHVAMYIGNSKIIHASNPRSGIKISNMYYSTPCKYKRIFND